MKIELLLMERGRRVGRNREGGNAKGAKKELRCIIYTCKLPTINAIMVYCKCIPMKIRIKNASFFSSLIFPMAVR